jgi:hypothetical protein
MIYIIARKSSLNRSTALLLILLRYHSTITPRREKVIIQTVGQDGLKKSVAPIFDVENFMSGDQKLRGFPEVTYKS